MVRVPGRRRSRRSSCTSQLGVVRRPCCTSCEAWRARCPHRRRPRLRRSGAGTPQASATRSRSRADIDRLRQRVRDGPRHLRRTARGARGQSRRRSNDGHGRARRRRARRPFRAAAATGCRGRAAGRSAAAQPPAAARPGRGGGVQVPQGAAGAGGPEGTLPVYGNTSALSKVFNPDMAVIGNFVGAAGKNTIDPMPALSCRRPRRASRPSSIRTRGPTSSCPHRPEGSRSKKGFLTFTDAAGRPADEGRQDEGAVRQGQHACTPHAAVGRRAAGDDRTCSAATKASTTRASRSRS